MVSKMVKCLSPKICFQEVPDEISLTITVTGCPWRCSGCHSEASWSADTGIPLTVDWFVAQLDKYDGMISCVLFLGGEWASKSLIACLRHAKQRGLKTCLYTGATKVSSSLMGLLDFLKTGRWEAELGGLDSPITNQRFVDLHTGNLLNYRFLETKV